MTLIKYIDWELIVDRELTQNAYNKISTGSAEICNCLECMNFVNQREYTYPKEIMELFNNLGIDYKKESEISHFAKLENGLHFYSGWFHFKGDFKGKDCVIQHDKNSFTKELYKLTDNFSIGFRKASDLSFFEDKNNLVQIEFETKIPWTINKTFK